MLSIINPRLIGRIGARTVNVDTYTDENIYIARNDCTGALPTGLSGNRYLIISEVYVDGNSIAWGMQLAIGFGSNKIAVRNSPYGSGAWESWRYI